MSNLLMLQIANKLLNAQRQTGSLIFRHKFTNPFPNVCKRCQRPLHTQPLFTPWSSARVGLFGRYPALRSVRLWNAVRRNGSTSKTKSKTLPSGGEARKLLSLAKPERWRIVAAVGCLFVSSGVMLVMPFGIGKVIDIIYNENHKDNEMISTLQSFCLLLAGVFVVGAVANFGRVFIIQTAGQRIIHQLRSRLFGSIVSQEMAFFDRTRSGELINRLSADTTVVGGSVTQNVSDGLRAVISGIGGISMMLYVSPQLTGVALCVVPLVAGMSIVYGRYMKRITRQVQDSLAVSTQIAEERISNMRTVRAFSHEPYEVSTYVKSVDRVLQLSYKEAIARAIFFGCSGLSGNMVVLTVFYYGGILMNDSLITVGQLSSFMLYAAYVGVSINGVSSFYSDIMKGLGASSRLFELVERQPEISNSAGTMLSDLEGHITLNSVTFNYPTRADYDVLSDLSLEVKPGNILAVVGPSGSGKSTIASLILRYYDPQQGSICIDGEDIRTFEPASFRQHIGVVSQEPTLFSASIFENITYGAPHPELVTEEQVHHAARQANAFNFISAFPQGFKTTVGERGIMLSGGQKQRIAIARAILKDPKILILDEATSALDAESEYLVQEAMRRIMQGRTVITIAHRLSTIAHAHCIAVLDNGQIVEHGTYQQLLNLKDGKFKQLVERQTIDNN